MFPKRRKGLTIIELLVVLVISSLVLSVTMLTYDMLTKSTRKKEAEAETEEYLNMLNLAFQRTFATMTAVKLAAGDSTPITIYSKGWLKEYDATTDSYKTVYYNADSFSAGCAVIDPPFTTNNYSSSKYGNVLILLVFTFDNPLLNRATTNIDMYRALGISHYEGKITQDSNFVYIEMDGSGNVTDEKVLIAKPKRLWIRKVLIAPYTRNGIIQPKLLNITLGVRNYGKTPKYREDRMPRPDPYNYETTKLFTLYIRSQ